MPTSPLFSTNPLDDLSQLVSMARQMGARRLLVLAGKYPVCRVGRHLSEPLVEELVHFSQLEHLAAALLSPEDSARLDQDGAVEIWRTISGRDYAVNVFFGDGSHNVVVFLQE